MQVKTINKIIKKKMNAWTESLPEKLRKEVRDNTLVSGGCIASLFLQEPINDFDVYIMDIDVLLKLADHYARAKNVKVLDGRKRESYVKDLDYIDGETNLSLDVLRLKSLKDDQIKLDIPSEGYAYKLSEKQEKEKDKFRPVFFSQNAISLTDDLQIVLRFSGIAEEIHKNFDFIHATNYWTYKDGLVMNERALTSLLTRQLSYQGSLYPLTSIIRMKKFILRKWQINAGEILKIMFQISLLDLQNPIVLEEQLIGVDIAYFGMLIEYLNNSSESEWSSEFMNKAIDKVFNEYE